MLTNFSATLCGAKFIALSSQLESSNDRERRTSRSSCAASDRQGAFSVLALARLLSLIAFFTGVICANVCTPLSAPANGPFPAIPANGIDGISWSVARVEWTSDASGSAPATREQIQYATAAEWAANPGVYPHITAQQSFTYTNNSAVQQGILSNLLPNTTYHVLAQSYQGGAWCSASDQTFTTLPNRPDQSSIQHCRRL